MKQKSNISIIIFPKLLSGYQCFTVTVNDVIWVHDSALGAGIN